MQANLEDSQDYNSKAVELKDFEDFRSLVI